MSRPACGTPCDGERPPGKARARCSSVEKHVTLNDAAGSCQVDSHVETGEVRYTLAEKLRLRCEEIALLVTAFTLTVGSTDGGHGTVLTSDPDRVTDWTDGGSWSRAWVEQASEYLDLLQRVMDQTTRRVLQGESVPALEKVVSLFEPHTDIIVKGGRGTQSLVVRRGARANAAVTSGAADLGSGRSGLDHCRAAKRRTLEIQSQRGKARRARTYRKHYGHKVNLATGRSGLALDVVVEAGNPADSARCLPMLERHIEHYGAVPSRVAFDGGYASRANLKDARELGIEHVVFNKKRGLKVADMTPSSWLYGQLKRFRAGIEAGISYLKRCFGLGRCLWRGLPHFTAYVHSAVFTHNLMRLARLRPKPG